MVSRRLLLTTPLLAAPFTRPARAAQPLRLGQATTSLSFLPVWAARARGDFSKQGIDLTWASVPGGDPAALAALDAGDLDVAAVGGETALQAIGKGQPFSVVMSLMSRVTLDLVAGPKVNAEVGDPLEKRLAALKGATVGVSAVGGTQDRAVRWLAAKGKMARTDVQVAMVGGPPALQAALENKRIDAFILSPPEGQIAAAGGYGRTLIGLADDFPQLRQLPFLVLVAKRPFTDEARLVRAVRALQDAAAFVLNDPASAGKLIGPTFFAKVPLTIVQQAIAAMKDGVAEAGRLSQAGIDSLVRFAAESGNSVGTMPEQVWTNALVDQAKS